MPIKYYAPKPEPIRMTQAGLDEAREEHSKLSKEREEILVRLQTAREMGDLSENGAYKYAKQELRDTDRRLRHLNKLLRFGVVTESSHSGRVDFGSKVTLNNGNMDMYFEMVSGYESDPGMKKLSVYSPIGKAILGRKSGDSVDVTVPAGVVTYRIVKVE